MSKKKSKNKKVKNATPLFYDGIKFKSKLEVYCYNKLKENNIEAPYEENTFVIIDAFVYNDEKVRKMTYKPDFVGKDFVIECKGKANDAFPLRWKIFKRYLFDNNLNYKLYLPRNKKDVDAVIEDIKNHYNDRKTVLQ
ncbi:MAG TPA: DUF1064 domain-containing protein [Halanaerobiales bacterium]|nr:DUF1064 domain-containing protein [Halanaerobiales bacterium]